MTRLTFLLSALRMALAPGLASAAKAPASLDMLIEESHHVITGTVLSVESKIQKSTADHAPGLKDEVFLIKVEFGAKGGDIKPGDEVVVLAWRPAKALAMRPPGTHEAFMPNGITTRDLLAPKG